MNSIDGLFLERKGNRISLCVPQKNETIELELHNPWKYFPFSKVTYLTPLRIVEAYYLGEYQYDCTPDTLIILNPDFLVNAHAITSAASCVYRAFTENVIGEQKPTLPMIRGSILHEALSLIVSQDKPVSNALEVALNKFFLPLSYLNANMEELIPELKSVLNGLAHSAPTLMEGEVQTETTFISPLYGLLGRIDFLVPKKLFELKTGQKIPPKELNTWYTDLVQAIIYMQGLSITSKAVNQTYIIYSGEGVPAFRPTEMNYDLLQKIHMARNFSYLIQFEGYFPSEKERNPSKCEKCFFQEKCQFLFEVYQSKKGNIPFQYLTHFSALIQQELKKNRQEFAYLWKFLPKGREKIGKAISGLSLIHQNQNLYEYSCQNISELRSGEPVILSRGDPVNDQNYYAIIASINRNSVLLESSNKLPQNAFLDSYSPGFMSRRLNKNLFQITFGTKSNHKTHHLIVKGESPEFQELKPNRILGLDQSQQEAINLAFRAKDYCMIQGPAGTGKTYTIAKLVDSFVNQGLRILLTAYTNTAVDNIIIQYIQVSDHDITTKELVRLGIEQVVDSKVQQFTLENTNIDYHKLTQLPIVAATTTTIGRGVFDDLLFDVVIVDEASQMTEPSILAAITKGNRFILVGDEKQLPPLIQSTQAEKLGLGTSLFERLKKLYPNACVMLQYQYRMNEQLMEFSNQKFYENKVQAATQEIAKQVIWDILPQNEGIFEKIDQLFKIILDPDHPLVYLQQESVFDRHKRVNENEAKIIKRLIYNFQRLGLKMEQIGIIAPFRGQVAEIRRVTANYDVVIDTIDRFQGSDKEVIILSLCTFESPNILEDERRLNVALTRAKKKMIIVGTGPSESSIPILKELYYFLKENCILVSLGSPIKSEEIIEESKKIAFPRLEVDFQYQDMTNSDINEKYTHKISHTLCVLCQKPVDNVTILKCPVCEQAYHLGHIEEWLFEHETCVTCQSKIQLIK